MKPRRTLLAITALLLSSLLSGCIVVPLGHHHHHRDYRSERGYDGGYERHHDRR